MRGCSEEVPTSQTCPNLFPGLFSEKRVGQKSPGYEIELVSLLRYLQLNDNMGGRTGPPFPNNSIIIWLRTATFFKIEILDFMYSIIDK